MDDLLRKEIVGDWNNLKGTEYHLVYALWLLVCQRAPRVEPRRLHFQFLSS